MQFLPLDLATDIEIKKIINRKKGAKINNNNDYMSSKLIYMTFAILQQTLQKLFGCQTWTTTICRDPRSQHWKGTVILHGQNHTQQTQKYKRQKQTNNPAALSIATYIFNGTKSKTFDLFPLS